MIKKIISSWNRKISHGKTKELFKVILILVIGLSLAGLMSVKEHLESTTPIQSLVRNNPSEGDESVSLIAETSMGKQKINLNLGERVYQEEEIYSLYQEFEKSLPKLILGTNKDLMNLKAPLNLQPKWEGYPFEVEYSFTPNQAINKDGELNLIRCLGEEITIQCMITYGVYEWEYNIDVIFREVTDERKKELIESSIWENITAYEETTREDAKLELPGEIGNQEVTWTVTKKRKGIYIGILTLCLAGFISFMPKARQRKALELRTKAINDDYHTFAFRLAMLLSAGLSPRQAFERIALTYRKSGENRVLFEEINNTYKDIVNGVPEAKAYAGLAERCENKGVKRMCRLLSQNLKRGSVNLANQIREEARDAAKETSEEIKRRNETLSTKLLFPTMLLLLVVMVIVMVPAFSML